MWSYDFGPAPDRPHGPSHGTEVEVAAGVVVVVATAESVGNVVSAPAVVSFTAAVSVRLDDSGVALEHAASASRAQQVTATRFM